MVKPSKPAFTLLELLVVIGIILVLMSMLLPVVSMVRNAAYKANTEKQISNIVGGIERYYTEFSAYPGPFSNDKIAHASPAYSNFTVTSASTTYNLGAATGSSLTINSGRNITSAENLVLGLLGALNFSTAASPAFAYDKQQLGNGPLQLNPQNPKRWPAFLPYIASELSTGFSGLTGARDTEIPEFVDRFPDNGQNGNFPGVIIYLRANVSAPKLLQLGRTPTSVDYQYQYNLADIASYVSNSNTATATYDTSFTLRSDFLPVTSGSVSNVVLSTGNESYFGNPKLSYYTAKAVPVARQQDSYWLISPGADRIYGTKDDITNFGGFK